MTPQDIEVLKKIRDDYIIYDGYYPRITKEYDVLNRAIRDLKETVPREVYEHEYELRKNLETEILHLERIINNRWIPVEEALPQRDKRAKNISEEVQVTVKDEFGIVVDIAYYDYAEKEWRIELFDDGKVLAWKPLPKPYKSDLYDTNSFDNNKFGG
jgi:alanyl-tRNA synthetase